MSFEIQIEDSFDFKKEYIRCTASRRVLISSDKRVTPEILASALENTKVSFPDGFNNIEEVEFLDKEEEDKARRNHDLLQKIAGAASKLLAAAPSIFSGVSGSGFLEMVEYFPTQPSYYFWVNGVITSMPQIHMGEGYESFTPLFLCVDRSSGGVDVRFVFEIGVSSLSAPIESGDVINTVEISAYEEGTRMIFDARDYISFETVTAPAAH